MNASGWDPGEGMPSIRVRNIILSLVIQYKSRRNYLGEALVKGTRACQIGPLLRVSPAPQCVTPQSGFAYALAEFRSGSVEKREHLSIEIAERLVAPLLATGKAWRGPIGPPTAATVPLSTSGDQTLAPSRRVISLGNQYMPEMAHLWHLAAPTPTFPPLDSEDLLGNSAHNINVLENDFGHDSFQVEDFVSDLEFVHHVADPEVDQFVDERLRATSDWSTGPWIFGDPQSLLDLTGSVAPEHITASLSIPSYQGVESDLSGLPQPTISPSSLCYTPTTEQDESTFAQVFLDRGDSFHMPDVNPNAQTIPIPNLKRPPGLPRRRSRYSLCKLGQSMIPRYIVENATALDPMQRWQESPPEDEPASLSAIMHAVNKSENIGEALPGSGGLSHNIRDAYRRPASLASSNSGNSASSWQSSTSTRSAVSKQQNPLAVQSPAGGTRVDKSKRKSKGPSGLEKERIFCCTFCCDTFKSKFDWSRHEKSLHLNLGGWACTPHGGATVSPVTGRIHCAYCNCLEPSAEHLDEHNHSQCSDVTRTFRRKDHLVQHLRLVHSMEILPLLDDWKIGGQTITSRCGFCDQRLESWDQRADHLATHFRKGMTMHDWRGDHDFPPDVAAKITNSLPPYLLGWESKTFVPFSATDGSAKDQLAQISKRADWAAANSSADAPNGTSIVLENPFPPAQTGEMMVPLNTLTGILTQHLSRYARQQMSLGIIPTDDMFQQESRRLLYDSEDTWNQSIADNPAWLSAFRQQLRVQSEDFVLEEKKKVEGTQSGL
ncbi:uncharacterized protein N7482_007520 [Penicillium canariense]|uniref:C2H2-type domain-containing protein n=1 Tax=Penicillium canariense TaxID=189055 RepID=A0A9W9LKN8_9EURO|nr:uncharacterized protein N7482_007520 [Penicillium canariense]KAJ5160516.1 hypothetical protein N7482_007520 [Penicillium canariense]